MHFGCLQLQIQIQLIVQSTNRKIEEVLDDLPEEAVNDSTRPYLRTTTVLEIYALIGLMFFRGLLGLNNHGAKHLFSEKTGHHVFGATMSKNRYAFLTAHLCFDDHTTRRKRWQHDRFTAFRDFFDMFNGQSSRHVVPSEYLSLDETLYPMRNKVAFRQYNPDKPAKYGMLFKSINDARICYTYRSVVYAGKPIRMPSAFYVSGTDNDIKELVESLERCVVLDGRNISMDRLYTSIPIARWLLSKNLTCVGTMLHRRIGIPEEVKTTRGREKFSSKVFYEKKDGDLSLTS